MSTSVVLNRALSWRQVAAIAEGAPFSLSEGAEIRIRAARLLVESIVAKGIRAYGVNTGVGALCDIIVEPSQLRHLSRNIVMSHAAGVGAALGRCEVRAIIAAAINNFGHGYSGVRLEVVDRLMGHLRQDWIPEVPAAGSVGYLSHMAHVALVVIGEGHVQRGTERRRTLDVLKAADIGPMVLEAKEGLSLVNGTPCVTGLTSLALLRAERLLNWADVISAMSFENLRGQVSAFDAAGLALRASAEVSAVGERLRSILDGSGLLAANAGRRMQDALSLRAIPQVHGAAREVFARTAAVVDTELKAVTDNPVVVGTEDEPRSLSQANALGAAIGLSADALGVAMAEVAAMSERRIDRLVNPLVSGLPAFLASDSGAGSGFMIAQYTAAALVADNRRLAAPASLDGGSTSGLQEDHLCHATPAALKLLRILDNAEFVLSIELLAAVQAYDLQPGGLARAQNTEIVHRAVRGMIPHYRDDRPLARDIERVREIIREPTVVDFELDADEESGIDEYPASQPRREYPPARAEAQRQAVPQRRTEPPRHTEPQSPQPAESPQQVESAQHAEPPKRDEPSREAENAEAKPPAFRPRGYPESRRPVIAPFPEEQAEEAREVEVPAASVAVADDPIGGTSDPVAEPAIAEPAIAEPISVAGSAATATLDAGEVLTTGGEPEMQVITEDVKPEQAAKKSRAPRRRSKSSRPRKAAKPATSS